VKGARRRQPENRRTTGDHRAAGRFAPGNTAGAVTRFQPGRSGNARGRPKSLAAYIRAQVGDDGERIVRELLAVLSNRRRSAWGRVQAAAVLLDRGWGKAPQEVTITNTEDRRRDVLRFATDDELHQLEELMNRLEARARDGVEETTDRAPLTSTQGDM
jgi:hypothetical protein